MKHLPGRDAQPLWKRRTVLVRAGLIALGSGGIAAVIIAFMRWLMEHFHYNWETLSQIGDFSGLLNTTFSFLAFCLLLLTFWQQQRESQRANQAHEETSRIAILTYAPYVGMSGLASVGDGAYTLMLENSGTTDTLEIELFALMPCRYRDVPYWQASQGVGSPNDETGILAFTEQPHPFLGHGKQIQATIRLPGAVFQLHLILQYRSITGLYFRQCITFKDGGKSELRRIKTTFNILNPLEPLVMKDCPTGNSPLRRKQMMGLSPTDFEPAVLRLFLECPFTNAEGIKAITFSSSGTD